MTTSSIPSDIQSYIINTLNGAVRECAAAVFPDFFSKLELEDVAGTAILYACRSISKYNPSKGSLYTWLKRIARNTVLTEAGKKSKRACISSSIEDYLSCSDDNECIYDNLAFKSEEPAPDSELESKEFLRMWREKIPTMSEKENVFLKYIDNGLKPKEIAKMEGCTSAAASMRIFHLKEKLKQPARELAEEFGIHCDKLAS